MNPLTERRGTQSDAAPSGRNGFTTYMTCVATLAACRSPNLVIRQKITDPGTTTEILPTELRDARAVRDGRWKATMEGNRRTTSTLYRYMKEYHRAKEIRRTNSTDVQWEHHLNILARQSVELLTPACHTPEVDIICQGRPATAWSTFYDHKLTEVRDLARQLRALPADGHQPSHGRRHMPPVLPDDFDEAGATAANGRHAASAARREAGPTAGANPTRPAVHLIDYDGEMDLHLAAAAAYEHGNVEYGTGLRRIKNEIDGEAIAQIVRETATARRWAEQPPARALGMLRMTFEITASVMSWMGLAHMASRTGATVLLQPVGVPAGWIQAPETVADAGAEQTWNDVMEAHDTLHSEMEADGAPPETTQYALTRGHLCRGVISTTGDRIIRIIDWMILQRGSAPYNSEITKLGKHMFNHLAKVGPTTRHAVFQPRSGTGEPA